MKGRSLWYAFMLTWLSATNTASLPKDQAPANISVAEQSVDGNIGPFIDSKESDAPRKTLVSEKSN